MPVKNFEPLIADVQELQSFRRIGAVAGTQGSTVTVRGLSNFSRIGDLVELGGDDEEFFGEITGLSEASAEILTEHGAQGLAVGSEVRHVGPAEISPSLDWLGRVIDPFGRPLDGRPLMRGSQPAPLMANPPPANLRGRLGDRVETGVTAFNTFLPIVRGQRLGLFAGSGVGKSTLLSNLAKGVQADVVVLAMIGERGRELREFIEDTLGAEGMKRSVIIAATSDQSPIVRRRAAWAAMAVAEYFRDQGGHVLFLADSITRFAEAHREIATSAGEQASLRGFPPSTSQAIMSLCERAGPGKAGVGGDITAIFSVLVAGSDMDEPIADITRGVLDGHAILDRKIAERGRFPAVDILKSVSRSLPDAATPDENELLAEARILMSAFEDAELMIQAGLYQAGSDELIDRAIAIRPKLEVFLSQKDVTSTATQFETLAEILA